MSTGQGSSELPPAPAATWTEPPWSGWIETTGDALLILEAARRGLIPRVTRRLVDSERKMITSGSVFVFDEDESGIKRWTDGFFWSPSRILGNFLLYRETDKRGAGHRGPRSEPEATEGDEHSAEPGQLSRPKSNGLGVDKHRERSLMGSLTNSYKFKNDGLMKKTFSLAIGGVSQHLISYYKIEDVESGRLRTPSSLPELGSLDISPEYLDKTHFRNPPKVEIGVDGIPRYRGEADDIDSSPSLLPAPLSSGPPLLSERKVTDGSSANSNKRPKRPEPYGSTQIPSKRPRKQKSGPEASTSASSSTDPLPPAPSTSQQPQPQSPPQSYPDTSAAIPPAPHPAYPPYGYYPPPAGYAPGPPPHMYSPANYPPTNGSQNGHASAPSPQQYAYAPYSLPVSADSSSQPQHQQQPQAYYSYYPAPPHAPPYTGYPAVAWPHYTGYPPQPVPQSHHQAQAAAVAPPSSSPVVQAEAGGGASAGEEDAKGVGG